MVSFTHRVLPVGPLLCPLTPHPGRVPSLLLCAVVPATPLPLDRLGGSLSVSLLSLPAFMTTPCHLLIGLRAPWGGRTPHLFVCVCLARCKHCYYNERARGCWRCASGRTVRLGAPRGRDSWDATGFGFILCLLITFLIAMKTMVGRKPSGPPLEVRGSPRCSVLPFQLPGLPEGHAATGLGDTWCSSRLSPELPRRAHQPPAGTADVLTESSAGGRLSACFHRRYRSFHHAGQCLCSSVAGLFGVVEAMLLHTLASPSPGLPQVKRRRLLQVALAPFALPPGDPGAGLLAQVSAHADRYPFRGHPAKNTQDAESERSSKLDWDPCCPCKDSANITQRKSLCSAMYWLPAFQEHTLGWMKTQLFFGQKSTESFACPRT